MQTRGILAKEISTECKVVPDEQLADAIARAKERAALEQDYVDVDKEAGAIESGNYSCEKCGHEAPYTKDQLKDAAPACPLCGTLMSIHSSIGFSAFWDANSVMSFTVTFDEPELNEVMDTVREAVGDSIEKLNDEVDEATAFEDREVELSDNLQLLYKSDKLSTAQLWYNVLEAIQKGMHNDNWLKVAAWVLNLAKAYDQIDDFDFDVKCEGPDLKDATIEIIVLEKDENKKPTSKEDPKQRLIAPIAIAALSVCFEFFQEFIRKADENNLLAPKAKMVLIGALRDIAASEDDLPMECAEAAIMGGEPGDYMKAAVARMIKSLNPILRKGARCLQK